MRLASLHRHAHTFPTAHLSAPPSSPWSSAQLRRSPAQATFLNALSWASYGLLVAGDPIIWAPNVLGLAAATVQLGLIAKYGIYKPPPASAAPKPPAA